MQGQAWPQKHVDVITRDNNVDFPHNKAYMQLLVNFLGRAAGS